MLGSTEALRFWKARCCGVDLAQELGEEAGSSSRGDLTRIVLSMHRVGGERCTKAALLG
jgi:hypothetical protein